MAIYKVKATVLCDVEYEVEADSEDQAISEFIATDAVVVINEGKLLDVNTENEKAELSEAIFKVHVTSVSYDVTFNDCWDLVADEHPGVDEDSEEFDKLVNAKIDEIKASLPQELDFEIDCEKKI